MTIAAPRTGQCPNCGAAVDFKIGASRATVCSFCQSVVVRAGQDFQAIGKAADVIPTGSKIALGSKGSLDKVAFEVIGRLQYEWQAGVWDEWYVAFTDGRWGWLAEAQGRFYVTFKVPPRPLPQKGVVPGASVFIEGLGRFTVSDVKHARIVGIQGELPDHVTLGDSPLTADMESEKGGFATLDFGVAGQPSTLFVGRQVEFEALHLGGLAPAAQLKAPKPTGEKLKCPNCAAPVTLLLPEQSVRVTCQSCGNLLDCSQGAFQVIEAISKGKHQPRIPLGTKGKLRGRELMIVGFMTRSCRVDGARYPWDEYLLWEEKTQDFSWLVDSDGHWQLAQPISVATVHVADDADYNGRRFRHFSNVKGEVELVLGEFYWEVAQGDFAKLDDYVAPPEGLSCERTPGEVNWSHVDHLTREEVAAAFSRTGLAQAVQTGVGAVQPWPYEASWRSMSHWMLGGLALLAVLVVGLAARPSTVYVDQSFTALNMQAGGVDAVGPQGEKVHSFISQPFELDGREALDVEFSSDVSQTWTYAAGAIINDDTGESSPFGVESSYYYGVDDGESWSEGSRTNDDVISAPGAGKSIVRADLQWESGHSPSNMRLRVLSSSFSITQLFVVIFLLLWPLLFLLHKASFERARWDNSNVHPTIHSSGDDD